MTIYGHESYRKLASTNESSFLLASLAHIGAHVAHNSLRNLVVDLSAVQPVSREVGATRRRNVAPRDNEGAAITGRRSRGSNPCRGCVIGLFVPLYYATKLVQHGEWRRRPALHLHADYITAVTSGAIAPLRQGYDCRQGPV